MKALFAVITLILAFYYFASGRKDRNIVLNLLFCITGFIFSYLVLAGALHTVGLFSVKKTLFAQVIVWAGLSGYSLFKGMKPSCDMNIRPYLIPVIISLLVMPVVLHAPHEYFAMGQDQGSYQTEAIMYMRGKTSRQMDYNELHNVKSESLKETFIEYTTDPELLDTMNYDETNIFKVLTGKSVGTVDEHSRYFLGIRTYASLLAMWGTFFGMSNMGGVNCLLLIMCIFWIYALLKKLGVRDLTACIACLVFAFSPIAIWVAKSTLTEMTVTAVWLVFFYLITGRTKKEIYGAALMTGMYGVVHMTVFIFVPLFFAIFLLLYFYTGSKDYVRAALLSVGSFFVTFVCSILNSPGYMLYNYRNLYRVIPGMTYENTFWCVTGACVILAVIAAVFLLIRKNIKISFNMAVLKWGIRALFAAAGAFAVLRLVKGMPALSEFSYLTLFAIVIMAGIAIPLYLFTDIFVFTDRWTDSREHLIMLAVFSYTVLIYSMLFYPQIRHYYYFSRYILMYVALVIVFAAAALDRLITSKGTAGKAAAVVMAAVALILFAPHDKFLLENKDDTRVRWDTVEELEETFELEGTRAVMMRKELFPLFYYDLKSIGIDVYPITDNYDEDIKEVAAYYGNAILIMDYTFDLKFESTSPVVRRIYNHDIQDLGEFTTRFFRLPYKTSDNAQTITLYRFMGV